MSDITVILTDAGNGSIHVDGAHAHQITTAGLTAARAAAISHLRTWATNGPVLAQIQEPSNSFYVRVHENGKVEPATVDGALPATPDAAPVAAEVPSSGPTAPSAPMPPQVPAAAVTPVLMPAAAGVESAPFLASAVPVTTRADLKFTNQVRERPREGIRGLLYAASGGHVNLGRSAKEAELIDLIQHIRRPFAGHQSTGVLALKGGIGKSSTTIGVGLAIAEQRGESPVAIDANPDSGDLAERALGEALYNPDESRSITDIVREIERIDSLTTLSDYLHIAGRLHVVAGEQDPALSDALTANDFLRVHALLSKYYRIALVDCGTGVSHPAMVGILSTVRNVVICSGFAVSGARRAKAALNWLREHGYAHLADSAVIVITDKDQVSSRVNRRAIEETLQEAARSLIIVPHDRKVADGDLLQLDSIDPQTKIAYQRIAAAVVDGYQGV